MLASDYSLNVEYIFYQIYHLVFGGAWDSEEFRSALINFWFWSRIISLILTVALLGFVVYTIWRIVGLRYAERQALRGLLQSTQANKPVVNEEWQRILEHMSSLNPNEWKLGIIAADNLLDNLVKTMQVPGESLGERLKNIEPSDFASLNAAWEAHKVRNRIAHESGYTPSEIEARRAINNYRQVFEEFKVI